MMQSHALKPSALPDSQHRCEVFINGLCTSMVCFELIQFMVLGRES
jgi:hypothetical protein